MFKYIQTIEAHNAGMPIRIVFYPNIPGSTMIEKKRYCKMHLDWLRKMLMYEPRGHRAAYGVLVTTPTAKDSHFGAIFMDNSGWHDMCGHASMGFASISMQLGLVDIDKESRSEDIVLDTPAGIVKVIIYLDDKDSIRKVSLRNVPSFIYKTFSIKLSRFKEINVPVAFGGDFYAIVELKDLGLRFDKKILPQLIELSIDIWDSLKNEKIEHPMSKDISGLYGVRFREEIRSSPRKEYGILIFGDPDSPIIDRSPSGTGSSAHLAYLYHKGIVGLKDDVEMMSVVNTIFKIKAIDEYIIDGFKAIIPEITTVNKGGFVTGFATWVLDPEDPVKEGFQI